MNIKLSEHFTYSKLLRFAAPTILMMLFTSIYSVVDGAFVSNYVGSTAFAATSFMMPIIMLLGCIGFMFGTGGSALVGKLLGEKQENYANQIFSLIVYALLIFGILLTGIGVLSVEKILDLYNIQGALKENCQRYGIIVMLATPFLIMEFFFHSLMVTAERPKLGLLFTAVAGISNILLDALFIIIFDWGIEGAAWATFISTFIGGFSPFLFFILPNSTKLHLGKTKLYLKDLLKAISNGMSEFISHISMSVVVLLYNYQLIKYAGENGVVAFGVIACTNFVFLSFFVGYAVGTAPIISYNYGANNTKELQNLFKKNIKILLIGTFTMTLLAELFSKPIIHSFISNNIALEQMAYNGFMIYVVSYIGASFNIYASAFFTALNNGVVSATISFMRTLVFDCVCILILPIFLGLFGIWSAKVVAEILTLIVRCFFVYTLKKKYDY